MKHVLFALTLFAPTFAAAYPNPNVAASLSAGDLVDVLLTQPNPVPLILADSSLFPSTDK
jgi:hypothetical protein